MLTITAVSLAALAGSVALWRIRPNAKTDTIITGSVLSALILIVVG